MRPKVVIESAYRGGGGFTRSENVEFAERVCRKAIDDGLNPIASHLYYTRFLNDNLPGDRAKGIHLGYELGEDAQEVWMCLRPGEDPSKGVSAGFTHWMRAGKHIKVMHFHPDGEFIQLTEEFNVDDEG